MNKDIKKKVLQKLREKMLQDGGSGMFNGGVGVTVKAEDKKSLLAGLKKASSIVKKKDIDKPELSQDEILEQIEKLKAMLPKKD